MTGDVALMWGANGTSTWLTKLANSSLLFVVNNLSTGFSVVKLAPAHLHRLLSPVQNSSATRKLNQFSLKSGAIKQVLLHTHYHKKIRIGSTFFGVQRILHLRATLTLACSHENVLQISGRRKDLPNLPSPSKQQTEPQRDGQTRFLHFKASQVGNRWSNIITRVKLKHECVP